MTDELDLTGQTIPRLVEAAAARFDGRIAIDDDGVRFTFTELAEACDRAARAFIAAGIESADRVALWAPNIHEWIIAAVGLQSAGGVLVPLNTRLKGAEAGYILRKSGARILCTVGEFLGASYVDMLRDEELPALRQTILLRGWHADGNAWDAFLESGKAVSQKDSQSRRAAGRAEDPSDILFTSGTTGKPKGVMTCHGQNLRAFEVWSRLVGLREGDRYLIINPFFHSFGYKAGWVAAIMRGATILPQQIFDVPAVLERIGKERVSVIPGPPTLYQSLLAHPERAKYDLSCLRLAVTGAAVVPVELVRRMHDELSFETVLTAYGLTETCGLATMCRVGDDAPTIATTSGRAIPGVEVSCVDGAGNEMPRGEPGEVVVRGYNVMQGYFEDPEATAETIDPQGWLHTGDVGVMDEAGNLRITDRIKDMFIMGGFNCYPAEIESLMFAHDDIAQVAVIGIADERMGEVGMAFVVPKPGRRPTPESVIAWCREHMANYKVPRRVEVVDALPMNAMGKVTKFVLREKAVSSGR